MSSKSGLEGVVSLEEEFIYKEVWGGRFLTSACLSLGVSLYSSCYDDDGGDNDDGEVDNANGYGNDEDGGDGGVVVDDYGDDDK